MLACEKKKKKKELAGYPITLDNLLPLNVGRFGENTLILISKRDGVSLSNLYRETKTKVFK